MVTDIDEKWMSTWHCIYTRRASPPHPLGASRLSERRLNARRWMTPATLGETKTVLATRDRNLNPVHITADVAIVLNSGVGA